MSEIRSVSVHLDADVAGYIAKMRLAGAETDKAFSSGGRSIDRTNVSLGHTSTNLGKVDTEARKVDTSISRVNNQLSQGSNQIDKYSGRLKVIGQALAIIGPGAVPIAAVAIPAVAGLSSELGALALGFVTTKLAVSGMKPAVDALNKYQLAPTAENAQAAHLALAKLPPDARDFARELVALHPAIDKLRQSAASGLFPGVEVGLQALTTRLPEANRLLHSTGVEVGHLAAEGGQALAGPGWSGFIRFIEHEGPPSLEQMGRSLGHVTHGVAELIMAGAPLEHSFLGLVLRGSVNFDNWATGAHQTQWLRDLIAYVDENGPRVEHFLDDTAQLLVDIIRAAAPLGGPVLNTLDLLAKVLDTIVGSPAGPVILATVSALSILSRGQALFGKVAATSWGQAIAGAQGYTAKLSAARVPLIRGGLALGGLAVAATGAASGMGLTNTASLALTGSLAGPWGAAVGAGVGLLLDFTHRQDNSAAATADFTSTLNTQTGAITDNTRAMAAQVLQQDGALDAATKLGLSLDTVTSAALGNKAALAEVQGQLAGITNPQGYSASGFNVVDPEQVKRAHDLQEELGLVGNTVADDQAKTRQLSDAMHDGAKAADGSTISHRRLRLALAAEDQATAQTAQLFRTLGKDVDNTKVSLDHWIRQMAAEARALHDFGDNAVRAADKGLRDGLIKQLETLGPQGALRMKQLANATQSEIAKANRAFDGYHRGAEELKQDNAYLSNHPPVLTVNGIPQSISELRRVQAALAAIRSKTITLTTRHATGGRTVGDYASGGYTGAGGRLEPRGVVHAGEVVIPQPLVKRDWGMLSSRYGHLPGFADGGVVTHTSSTPAGLYAGVGSGLGAAADDATRGLRGLKASLSDATKELDAERAHRQALAQQRQQVVSTTRDSFRSGFLGVTPDNPWSSGATGNPAAILRGDIHDARAFRGDIRKLRRRGLSAGLASQVTSLAGAEQLAGMSPAELRQLNHLYAVRQRASQAAGTSAGNAAFGAKLDAVSAEIRGTNQRVDQLTAAVKHTEHAQAQSAKDAAKAFGQEINHSASNAARRRHP